MTLHAAFARQAEVCPKLGSPFMGRLCTLLAGMLDEPGPIFARMRDWPGDVSAAGHSVPLRLCGALHGLVVDGTAPDLAAVYPPNSVPDAALRATILRVLTTHEARIQQWLDSPPQTNEVRRSAGLIAAGSWLSARFGLPLHLMELGASAGLNLQWDQMALDLPGGTFGAADATLRLTPDWTGPLPPAANICVLSRSGVDLTPLDPGDAADQLRLQSYLWPDQPDRRARTDLAIELARQHQPQLAAGDAAAWLSGALNRPADDALRMVFHTIAWQYFPNETKAACRAALDHAGALATDQNPLAWLGIEADNFEPGAGIVLRLWPGNLKFHIGRMDFHGRWINWTPPEG